MKRYHVTTFGCQMNEHDSERMKGMLDALGYVEAPAPDEADVLLEYDPTRQPPDATGPFEWGVFSAKLNDLPAAYGRTEHLALSALAKQLLKLAATRRKARGLTILDQAMAASIRTNHPRTDCDEVADLIATSYCLVAPKRLAAKVTSPPPLDR